jgi:hypothetical protein
VWSDKSVTPAEASISESIASLNFAIEITQ